MDIGDIPVDLEDTDDETEKIAIRTEERRTPDDQKEETKVVLTPRLMRKMGDIKEDWKKRCISTPLKPSERIIRRCKESKEKKALEAVKKKRKDMANRVSRPCKYDPLYI